MKPPLTPLQDDRLALFDRVAALTRAPDFSFAELRGLYEGGERLGVPSTVFQCRAAPSRSDLEQSSAGYSGGA